MNGELSRKVVVIPPTRPGWEHINQPVPCLVGKFHKKSRGRSYYSVDSPYLQFHHPELATELGSSWHWDGVDLSIQASRKLQDGDIPTGVVFTLLPQSRVTRVTRPELSDKFPNSIADKIKSSLTHVLCALARDDCLADVHDAALAAHAKLNSQLISPSTALLLQGYHKQLSN